MPAVAEKNRQGYEVQYRINEHTYSAQARIVINAAGPWVNQVLKRIRPEPASLPIEWVAGTHLLLPAKPLDGIFYVEAHQDHKGVGYHHEGEEFVYVLQGKIEVAVGEHLNILNAGDSLHFNSAIRHNLKNISDETAELLVVIYAP